MFQGEGHYFNLGEIQKDSRKEVASEVSLAEQEGLQQKYQYDLLIIGDHVNKDVKKHQAHLQR